MRNLRVFWRVPGGEARACARCGAKDIIPDPGPLGTVADLFGLARYMCSDCRHRFWLREGSRPHDDRPVPSFEETGWTAPDRGVPPVPPASLAVLDAETASAPTGPTGPADLSVLDADLARLRDEAPRRRRRRRRVDLDGTLTKRP